MADSCQYKEKTNEKLLHTINGRAVFCGRHCYRRPIEGGRPGVVPADAVEARQAMQEIGVDLDQHRSQGVDEAVLKPTDVVIVMTRRHLAELDEAFPGMPQERWLLRAFEQGPEPVPKAKDLPDPIGKPIEAYRKLLQVITPAMDHLALFLRYRS